MPKYLKYVLKKLCKMVGAKYSDIDFKEPQWFMKHTWTREKENIFMKWMVDYLHGNTKARKEITTCGKNKRCIEQAVEWFLFNYGWKYE
jgi:hypothetical protein